MKKVVLSLLLISFLGACATSSQPGSSSSEISEGQPIYSLVLMREGSQLLQQGEYEGALKKFQKADSTAPGNATTQNMLGLCYLNLSQYDKALSAFNRTLSLVPNFTDAMNNRGLTYMAMGQYRMAEMDFNSVLMDTTYPHHWAVYYNLGLTYLKRGMKAAADVNFSKAITAPRPVYEAFIRLADLKTASGDSEAAIRILEEAKVKFPDRIEAPFVLGRLLNQLGRREEAEPYLRYVLTASPSSDLGREAQAILEEDH